MLIAITGGDGAGKSIVVREVVKRLHDLQVEACRIDRWDVLQPQRHPTAGFLTATSDDIRSCLIEMPTTPRLLFLLWTFALAVSDHACAPSHPVAALVDGYWMKHAASEIASGMDARWIEDVVAGLPRARLVLFLRVEPHQAWMRKRGEIVPYECGMDVSCSRDSFLTHQGRILDRLDAWSARDGWTVIDAALPLPVVVNTALEHILRLVCSPS